MALIRSDLSVFRLGSKGSETPALPKSGSGQAPMKASLGRTSAETPVPSSRSGGGTGSSSSAS
jgi:hypothetical protein